MPWGGRQEVDYTHPAFLFHAERVVRAVLGRYAAHPAVIGFQVDNEPGLMIFHNRGVFQRFVDDLRHRYATVEALNEAWGLVYWSHRLSTWADLWRPDGNYQPQYDLAWRTFQARLTTEFVAWQAGIAREYARDDQFVTTCIAYERPTVDDANLTRALDVTAGNPYYAMQDALAVPSTEQQPQGWSDGGSLDAVPQRRPDARQQAGALPGHRDQRRGHRGPGDELPGVRRAVASGRVGLRGTRRGDDRVLALAHEPLRHRDLLDRDPAPRPAARSGLRRAEPAGRGLPGGRQARARAEAGRPGRPALLRALQVGPGVPGAVQPGARGRVRAGDLDQRSYHRIFDAFYRGTFDAGTPARILHDNQLVDEEGATLQDPAAVAGELPVLLVPGLLVADDVLLDWLRAYAAAGGHLVLGPRTGYGDGEGRARVDVKPGRLAEAAGVRYQELSNLSRPAAGGRRRAAGSTSPKERRLRTGSTG